MKHRNGTTTLIRNAKRRRRRGSLVRNAFCATGEGGGVDPTCSPSSGSKTAPDWASGSNAYKAEASNYASEWVKVAAKHSKLPKDLELFNDHFSTTAVAVGPHIPEVKSFLEEALGRTGIESYRTGWLVTAEERDWLGFKKDEQSITVAALVKRLKTVTANTSYRRRKRGLVGVKRKRVGPNRIDPTRTQTLRRAFAQSLRKRFARIRYEIAKLVVEEDAFGLKEAAHTIAALTKLPRTQRLVIENEDCGTGAGGFKPGNTCGKGRGGFKELKIGDVVKVAAREILASERSFDAATTDSLRGRRSKTDGPLEAWVTEKGELLLVDGYHRFTEGVDTGKKEFDVKVVGKGYTDYWASPRNDDVLDVGEKYWGEPAANAFCPTGPGGGIDPTCSPSSGSLAPRPSGRSGTLPALAPSATIRLKAIAAAKYGKLEKRYGPKYAKAIIGAAMMMAPTTTVSIVAVAEMHRLASRLMASNASGDLDMTEAEIEEAARKLLEELEEEAGAGENGEQTANAFCPTGPGGGIDPTCSPAGKVTKESAQSEFEKVSERLFGSDRRYAGSDTRVAGLPGGRFIEAKVKIDPLGLRPIRVRLDFGIKGESSHVTRKQLGTETTGLLKKLKETVAAYHKAGFAIEAGAYDERRRRIYEKALSQAGLKKTFEGTGPSGFQVWNTDPVLNTRWKFQADAEKVTAFQAWLKTQIAKHLIGKTEEELWQKYVEAGFKRGAGRAFDDVKQSKLRKEKPELFTPATQDSLRDFYAGSKDEFLRSAFGRPEAVEKVKLLAGRSFDDLENVTADMSARISRSLTDGLVEGKGPLEIARDMAKDVDISRDRAELIARSEIVRAHSEGMLTAFEDLGVEEVGVAVEWLATDDNVVCPRCAMMEGVVLTIEEAHGKIPLHPACRCSWTAANVGESAEDRKDQTRTKPAIEEAAEEANVDIEVSKRRPEEFVANWPRVPGESKDWDDDPGFDEHLFKLYGDAALPLRLRNAKNAEGLLSNGWHPLVNAFCPTGEGGGIDPTCSPGGSSGGKSSDEHYEQLKKTPPAKGHVRLYRAADKGGFFGQDTSWAEDYETAKAYMDNPGFGGDTLHYADVPEEYVLDLKGAKGFRGLAESVTDLVKESDWDDLPKGIQSVLSDELEISGTTAHSKLKDSDVAAALTDHWRSRGYDYPYHAWENEKWLKSALAKSYDWVRHDFEDFPPGATTWVKLTDTKNDVHELDN